MANGNQRRPSRLQRVNTVELPPTVIERTWDHVRRGDVLLRLSLCFFAALLMWGVVRGWEPAFGYRTNYTPQRSLVARVDFKQVDKSRTESDRANAKLRVTPIFINNTTGLEKTQDDLRNRLNEIASAESIEKIPAELLLEFQVKLAPDESNIDNEQLLAVQELRNRIATKEGLERFYLSVTASLLDLKSKGLLDPNDPSLQQWKEELIKLAIRVPENNQFEQMVTISQVRSEDAKSQLLKQLKSLVGPEAGQLVFNWLNPRLKGTLVFDKINTEAEQLKAAEKVPDAEISYKANESILARGGEVLDHEDIKLLTSEHQAMLQSSTWREKLIATLAMFGMFTALFTLSGFYAYYREQSLLTDFHRFAKVLALAVLTVSLSKLASGDDLLRAEIVPLVIFSMTIAIAFHAEIALLLSAELALIITFTLGQGLAEYVIMLSAVATSVLLIGKLRYRHTIFFVALATALVVGGTSLGVNLLEHQPLNRDLFWTAGKHALLAMAACCSVSVLLPFIEQLFGVLTDLKLMELGDPAHPLLQQLVQRAPGTYNHSISVASIAEAAAEAIGARGLLVRVGAYFHDIGKMSKPHYFVENQGREGNRHESLNPAMSTLVIIAHIKDGADMARQHHLPQPLIDFIQQHHGTTLVEYFYHRASKESENNPDAAEVDEASFRYPGPKPQTKEAGILMLADAAESASRSLVEPTPARIEGLIHELALKRLLDGQFDECGITLRELALVEESLSKSITAVYHGRIKYPEQRTA